MSTGPNTELVEYTINEIFADTQLLAAWKEQLVGSLHEEQPQLSAIELLAKAEDLIAEEKNKFELERETREVEASIVEETKTQENVMNVENLGAVATQPPKKNPAPAKPVVADIDFGKASASPAKPKPKPKPKAKVDKAKTKAPKVGTPVTDTPRPETSVSPPSKEKVETAPGKQLLSVFKEGCLTCTSLVPWGTESNEKCHYTQGNKHCPARFHEIVLGLDIDTASNSIAKQMIHSIQTGESEKLNRNLRNLNKRDPRIKDAVLRKAQELVKKGLK